MKLFFTSDSLRNENSIDDESRGNNLLFVKCLSLNHSFIVATEILKLYLSLSEGKDALTVTSK